MLRSQLRIVASVVLAHLRPRERILDSVTVEERVKPWDLDLNLHLNNVQYLKYFARNLSHYFLRSQYLGLLHRRGWNTLVVGSTVSYLRPLPPFARFAVTTRLGGFDDKYVYFEQAMTRQHALHATAILRMALVDRAAKVLSPEEVLAALLGYEPTLPRPAYAAALRQVTEAQRAAPRVAAASARPARRGGRP